MRLTSGVPASNGIIGLLPGVPPQLDEQSYLEASEAFGGEREQQLRLAAWWAARDSANSPDPKNLERLMVLLGTDPRDRILRAEALRSLGRHLETARELDQPFEGSLRPEVTLNRLEFLLRIGRQLRVVL